MPNTNAPKSGRAAATLLDSSSASALLSASVTVADTKKLSPAQLHSHGAQAQGAPTEGDETLDTSS